ncbi:MAG TPA: hypothetical protein VIK53_02445 [Verrucomicrobiae bacterium]
MIKVARVSNPVAWFSGQVTGDLTSVAPDPMLVPEESGLVPDGHWK